MTYKKGLAPLIIVLIVALGLAAGTTAGYAFREPIKKAVKGQTTADEIKNAVEKEVTKIKSGQSKFEIEGIATGVDATNKIITVKVKSSTDSVKELRLSETPITVSDSAKIKMGDKKDLKIADIPINSQVHVGGTISNGKFTATKIEVQKEDADENAKAEKTNFEVGGTIKEVGTDQITITVTTANKLAKDQKGKDLTIKVTSGTEIEKGDSNVAISDIKASDNVEVSGTIENSVYTASKVEVKVKEEGEKLEESKDSTEDIKKSNDSSNSETENKNKNSEDSSSDKKND